MDKVIIKDLLAHGIIGVNDWERAQPQDILINIELYADLRPAGQADSIADCINYHTVATQVLEHAEIAARFTVEALAEDLAHLCLADQRVQWVRIRVEKPGAVRFTKSVGVEIERYQQSA
jgi:FolB domain-containing protein